MKNINQIENSTWLKTWQRRALIIVGAIAGGAVAYALLRWLERRRLAREQAAQAADNVTDV